MPSRPPGGWPHERPADLVGHTHSSDGSITQSDQQPISNHIATADRFVWIWHGETLPNGRYDLDGDDNTTLYYTLLKQIHISYCMRGLHYVSIICRDPITSKYIDWWQDESALDAMRDSSSDTSSPRLHPAVSTSLTTENAAAVDGISTTASFFEFEKLPRELRDQTYDSIWENIKSTEDWILPGGWEKSTRTLHRASKRSDRRTHYNGPGHYVKRSGFKKLFTTSEELQHKEFLKKISTPYEGEVTGTTCPARQYQPTSPQGQNVHVSLNHNSHRKQSKHHQQFISPKMVVGGYKILFMFNKQFSSELAAHALEEMHINAKRRYHHKDHPRNFNYPSNELFEYFDKYPEYAAYAKRVIVQVNLGQPKETFDALVKLFKTFKVIQHVEINVYFAGLWEGSYSPSDEEFEDLLILKEIEQRGFAGVGEEARVNSRNTNVVLEFKRSVPFRDGTWLTKTARIAMEGQYQNKWKSIVRNSQYA